MNQGGQTRHEQDTLLTVLSVAVPLRLRELEPLSGRRAREMGRNLGAELSSLAGEAIQRRTPGTADDPGTAAAFNKLAKGIAILATYPGGVPVFGRIWCARHSPSGTPGDGTCPECLRDRPDPDTEQSEEVRSA